MTKSFFFHGYFNCMLAAILLHLLEEFPRHFKHFRQFLCDFFFQVSESSRNALARIVLEDLNVFCNIGERKAAVVVAGLVEDCSRNDAEFLTATVVSRRPQPLHSAVFLSSVFLDSDSVTALQYPTFFIGPVPLTLGLDTGQIDWKNARCLVPDTSLSITLTP